MTDRTDVALDFSTSPRIAEVQSPSVEFIAQDIVDTLRGDEFSFQGASYLKLLNAAGKEDLGGGVSVGITASLQDVKVAFEPRTAPAETGAVTTGSGVPVNGRQTFIDTSATFITNGVQRGSLVINFTDNSIADVFSVDSETQLTTRSLVNGIGNTYDVSDTYHVFNIIQCDMSGGNVVAIDSGGSPINPILPTAFTQVVRTSSSSSTLTSQTLLEFSSYQNAAWIDTTNGSAGTAFPLGTRESPTNNIDDAKAIAGAIGSANIGVLGTLTLASGDDVTGCNLIGENHLLTSVTLDPGCNTTNTRFTDMSISGTYGGQSITSGCRLSSLSAMQGTFDHCQFEVGTHVLDNSSLTKILDCYSLGLNTFPTFDYNVTGANLIVRSWNGPANLINKTGVDFVCIDINSGIWVFDNTVNGTNISVRGVGKINSTASPAINDFVGSIENIAAAVWEEPVPGTRTAGTYSEHVIDDLLTVFKFNALK